MVRTINNYQEEKSMSLTPTEVKLCREYLKTWLIEKINKQQEIVSKDKYREYDPHILSYLLKQLKLNTQ